MNEQKIEPNLKIIKNATLDDVRPGDHITWDDVEEEHGITCTLRREGIAHHRDLDGDWWTGKLELRHVGEQDRVADFELPTDSYQTINAYLSATPFADRKLRLFLEGRNLNDAEAREHASFLKDLAPLPGRSFRLGVGYKF